MKVIGITGGIGSGKSIVSKVFKVLGIPVYDSDSEAKLLLNTSLNLRKSIIFLLGEQAFNEEGYNRSFVSKQVFNDEVLLQKLNDIVHPSVAKHFEEWKTKQKTDIVGKETALLFQTGLYKQMDVNILVWADESVRIKRIQDRDRERSLEQILAIMDKQGDWEKMKSLADFVVYNDGNEALLPQIKIICNKIR